MSLGQGHSGIFRRRHTDQQFSVEEHLCLHATTMQARISPKKAVCLSVECMDCDKTKDSYAQIFIPYERTFSHVFRHEEWLVALKSSHFPLYH